MPPPLLSIPERTEPASPTTERSPLLATIDDQPPIQPSLVIPPSPSLPSPATESRKRPLPQQVFDLLCISYRKRPTPTSTSQTPQQPRSCVPRCHRRRRTSFDNKYHSFPPPVFTERGQPRALDSRLYPELLADEEHSHGCGPDEDHRFWSSRPHLWAEIVGARQGPAGEPGLGQQVDPAPCADEREDNAKSKPTAQPSPLAEPSSAAGDPEAAPLPDDSSIRLSLRGGGPPVRLPEAQRLPPIVWRLSGGIGQPPTAGEYRAWRARERQRIAEANTRNGREGQAGRGFWHEVCWVLAGARWENRRRKKKRASGGGDGGGGGEGDGASGEGGSVAGGDAAGGGDDGAGGGA